MYLATRPTAAERGLPDPGQQAPERAPARRRSHGGEPPRPAPSTEGAATPGPRPKVPRNVYLLGTTSMFTDISAEMVAAVLPLYFVTVLGFSPALFGLFDGAYRAAAVLLALAAAVTADRTRRHKRVAASGYGLSLVSRLGLVAASGAWVPVLGWLTVDRLGKGVRVAPRDALISLSSAPGRLGASFGVHRSLDTLGAVLGPLAAAGLLAYDADGYQAVFLASFFVALLGFGVLVLFVEEPRTRVVSTSTAEDGPPPATPAALDDGTDGASATASGSATATATATAAEEHPGVVRSVARLALAPGGRRLLLAVVALALVAPGDALLLLALERRMQLDAALFPLLFFGASVVFLVTAVPVGRLADRVGRVPTLLVGQLLLGAAFALVATSATGVVVVLAVLALIGLHYAATDGVLMALAASRVPADTRTTGLAVVRGAAGVGHLVAAATFGILWSRYGPHVATSAFAVATVVAVAVARALLAPAPAGSRR